MYLIGKLEKEMVNRSFSYLLREMVTDPLFSLSIHAISKNTFGLTFSMPNKMGSKQATLYCFLLVLVLHADHSSARLDDGSCCSLSLFLSLLCAHLLIRQLFGPR